MLKNKLQIYLITYNRKQKLQETLDIILADASPVKNFDITILDNASTDGTSELLMEYCKIHKNLNHIRHKINIGGNANICRAFELSASCSKDYAWILCDDDKYDFSNWVEVENHINNDVDLICVSDYVFPSNNEKENKAYQIFQMTFVPATIFKTKNITNSVLINMYDAILTMFQQSCLTISIINQKGSIKVLEKPIVYNGIHFEDKVDNKSLSYTRGTNENSEILDRRKNTTWVLGFINILSLLNDCNIKNECLEVSIPSKGICNSWKSFYKYIHFLHFNKNNYNYLIEIFKNLSSKRQFGYIKYLFSLFQKKIFSLHNTPNREHKIITILGFKIKLKYNNPTSPDLESP